MEREKKMHRMIKSVVCKCEAVLNENHVFVLVNHNLQVLNYPTDCLVVIAVHFLLFLPAY